MKRPRVWTLLIIALMMLALLIVVDTARRKEVDTGPVLSSEEQAKRLREIQRTLEEWRKHVDIPALTR